MEVTVTILQQSDSNKNLLIFSMFPVTNLKTNERRWRIKEKYASNFICKIILESKA